MASCEGDKEVAMYGCVDALELCMIGDMLLKGNLSAMDNPPPSDI